MGTLSAIASANLSADLEKIFTDFITDPTGSTKDAFSKAIDENSLKAPAVVKLVGMFQKTGVIKPMMFKALAELDAKFQAASAKPVAAVVKTAAAPAAAKAPRAAKPPADPNAPKAVRGPRLSQALDFTQHRGPGDPQLLKYNIEGFPAPIEKWWPRSGSVVRSMHEHLAVNELTLPEMLEYGIGKGWREDQVKKYWTYFSSQAMLNIGWTLQEQASKKFKMVPVAPNFDFRTNQEIKS